MGRENRYHGQASRGCSAFEIEALCPGEGCSTLSVIPGEVGPMKIQTHTKSRAFLLACVCLVLSAMPAMGLGAASPPDIERTDVWHGFSRTHFHLAGRAAYIVTPKTIAPGRPWVWRARFPDFHSEMDVALLGKGYHIAYVNVAGLFGSLQAVDIGNAFYEVLTTQYGFSPKPALEGVSRGGLFIYNWAARNPDHVACIYADTPVCDIKSWPGGRGTGRGSARDWQQCLEAYGMTEPEALAHRGNPIDHAAVLAGAGIPMLHIVSENDRVVPPNENTYLLRRHLESQGQRLDIISVARGTEKSHGHHFDHPQPERVVDFIHRHTSSPQTRPGELLQCARRVVFLGNSITYAGHYVTFFDLWLHAQNRQPPPVVINVGLPSETVSGLSEEGHAGGRFPRPDLAERLTRVLDVTQPDLVFACYGINCGIYQPLDEQRLLRYQQGIERLKAQIEAVGARLVLLTPPFYDDQRARKAFSYNSVLDHYSQWLMAQRQQGWCVIDLHSAMAQAVRQRRETNPEFTFQRDAVHPDTAGHWFMAQQLIRACGDERVTAFDSPEAMLTARGIPKITLATVRQRSNLRRNAYLSAAGHQRPGVQAGLPIAEAERQAQALTEQIRMAPK